MGQNTDGAFKNVEAAISYLTFQVEALKDEVQRLRLFTGLEDQERRDRILAAQFDADRAREKR